MAVTIGKRSKLITSVRAIADSTGVDPLLLDAIIITESAYNPWAVRYESAFQYLTIPIMYAKNNKISLDTEINCQKISWGLCQLMGGTSRFLGYNGPLTQLLDPQVNLLLGCKFLRKLQMDHPVLEDQIAAYNAGSPIKTLDGKYKNQGYVDKVKDTMAAIKAKA